MGVFSFQHLQLNQDGTCLHYPVLVKPHYQFRFTEVNSYAKQVTSVLRHKLSPTINQLVKITLQTKVSFQNMHFSIS